MRISHVLLTVALSVPLGGAPWCLQSTRAERDADALIGRGQWERAEAAYEELTKADPDNAYAWHQLAYARHGQGDFAGAAEAGRRAAEFPELRAGALYNLACSLSLGGRGDEAIAALEAALAAGFQDYDLLAGDEDLAAIRPRLELALPPEHEYEELRGRNGVRIPYRVVLPSDYEPTRSYRALLVFSPGNGGRRCTDWAIAKLFGEAAAASDWILVFPVAPERGWINHPSHHALEDLLKKVQKDYSIRGEQLHVLGFGEGARPATTYSRMSRRYLDALVVLSSTAFGRWDDDDLRRFGDTRVHMFVGRDDAYRLGIARKAAGLFEKGGVSFTLDQVEGGPMLEVLRGKALLAELDRLLASSGE